MNLEKQNLNFKLFTKGLKNDKIKILCFLDTDQGRDPEILLPVIYFAEEFLNAEVQFAVNWDIHEIYLKKPQLVLIANTIGSKLHFEISKYAHECGIKVFALVSEGNFRTNGTFNYWGFNTDKVFYQEYICLWSNRTLQFLQNEVPTQAESMVLTGATGFDRYKIYKFKSRKEFFKDNNLPEYKRVIGYAGWAFGKLFNDQGRNEIRFLHKNNPNRLKWMEDQMYLVESILKEAIEKNSDTLFILKRHPNEANQSITAKGMNEMMRLADYSNVMYIDKNTGINDFLSVADLWLGFETTTTLEYWLLKDNPTILINPDKDFARDDLHKGSVIVKNYEELQAKIDEFFSTGKVEDFLIEELKNYRSQFITDIVGFADGFNHLRAGYYLENVVKGIDRNKIVYKFKFSYWIRHILVLLGHLLFHEKLFLKIPKVKKHVWIFKILGFKKTQELKMEYWAYLRDFYKKNNISDLYESGMLWEKIGITKKKNEF